MSKTKIAVCSQFRDSQQWMGKKISQVDSFFYNLSLQAVDANCELEFFLLEGDSKDETYLRLEYYSKIYNINLIKQDIGGSKPSSCGSDERRKTLSKAGNICLDPAVNSDYDLIFWMESDLIPSKNMLKDLVSYTKIPEWETIGLISPLAIIWLNGKEGFYDGWAYEGLYEEKWEFQDREDFCKIKVREMKSIGSAALMNNKALKKHKINFQEGCFPRLCELLRENGYKVLCDSRIIIAHPSSGGCVEGRWV